MLHNPGQYEFTQTIIKYTHTFKHNPDKLILLMHCYAGHGMSFEARQVILINQFDSIKKFYKFVPAEIEIRNLAKLYRQTYHFCIFACCREIFVK